MELYVPKFQQKEILEVLAGEGVTFEATGKTFFQVVEGKERFEVAEVKAKLLETEAPAIYDEDSLRNLRAFRLPSGKKILLTDMDGNFVAWWNRLKGNSLKIPIVKFFRALGLTNENRAAILAKG